MKQKKRCCNYKPHRHAHLVRCDLSKYKSHHHPHYRSFDIQFLFSCILQNINKIPLLLSSKHGIYILLLHNILLLSLQRLRQRNHIPVRHIC